MFIFHQVLTEFQHILEIAESTFQICAKNGISVKTTDSTRIYIQTFLVKFEYLNLINMGISS